jgi:hypothetical protein
MQSFGYAGRPDAKHERQKLVRERKASKAASVMAILIRTVSAYR